MSSFRRTVLLVVWGCLVMSLQRADASALPEIMDKDTETFEVQSLSSPSSRPLVIASPGTQESNENEAWPQPQKRSTLLLDRLVYALQKAIKQDAAQQTDMELQRPGPDRRVYWRCYFNAVSCFRKK